MELWNGGRAEVSTSLSDVHLSLGHRSGSVYNNFRLARSCLGLMAMFIVWTHGCIGVSDIQKFKVMVGFFFNPFLLDFFWGGN